MAFVPRIRDMVNNTINKEDFLSNYLFHTKFGEQKTLAEQVAALGMKLVYKDNVNVIYSKE